MRYSWLLLQVHILIVCASILQATIIYVPGDVPTIQGGINACSDGDTVMVAPGTYYEYEIDFLGKAITVMGSDPEDSSVVAATVVDADSMGRVFTFQSGEDSSSVLTGLTITGGWEIWGGGIRCVSSPTIKYNIITLNHVTAGGGGVFCDSSSSPEISYNIISDNNAGNLGGGISCLTSSSRISNNIINANSVIGSIPSPHHYGGGISCTRNDLSFISSNSITANTVAGLGHVRGGGIGCFLGSSPLISNNVISDNSTLSDEFEGTSFGGGISCYDSSPQITNNIITGNMAVIAEISPSNGGGGFSDDSYPAIMKNVIMENRSIVMGDRSTVNGIVQSFGAGGGGVLCQFSSPYIINNIVAENWAPEGGGIMVNRSSSPVIENNIIIENTASNYAGGLLCSINASATIVNTILWNNDAAVGPEIYVGKTNYPSSLSVSYSDVEGGLRSIFVAEGCTLNWGDGMLDADPLFMTYKDYDYFLDIGSPCIDAGDPSIRDGISGLHPRWPEWLPNKARSDMGAYGGPRNKEWGFNR